MYDEWESTKQINVIHNSWYKQEQEKITFTVKNQSISFITKNQYTFSFVDPTNKEETYTDERGRIQFTCSMREWREMIFMFVDRTLEIKNKTLSDLAFRHKISQPLDDTLIEGAKTVLINITELTLNKLKHKKAVIRKLKAKHSYSYMGNHGSVVHCYFIDLWALKKAVSELSTALNKKKKKKEKKKNEMPKLQRIIETARSRPQV